MREIWDQVKDWQKDGKTICMATVVKVSGSSLRPEGSKMLLSGDGTIAGSVTGGCVEGAVFEEARGVLKRGTPMLLAYGVSNEQAWDVGLSCGGSVEIFVEALDSAPWKAVTPLLEKTLVTRQAAILFTILIGDSYGSKLLVTQEHETAGTLGSKKLDEKALSSIEGDWATRQPAQLMIEHGAEKILVFADVILPPPRLIIVGASHIAIPLVALAHTLEYYTIVLDARSAFATRERFPHADEMIVDWPADALEKLNVDASTCVVCLSHDDKLDNPTLLYAIRSRARYIGALGSRVTHAKRLGALRKEGATAEELARIHAPVGLKISARQPAEIALSIMAEIIATAHNAALG